MPDDVPEGQIKLEDILSQFTVVRTKDNRVAVHFPTKGDGGIDALEALKLIATGLNFVVDGLHLQEMEATLCQQTPEESRIVLAPAIPKEFLLKVRPD